ncbi:DUF2339 domain-containing protein [Paenibacillus gansuensis]|uniref:DUF2339 domain-containing protein n=1 Tax=Paenibacillus gansuensis TaxID=306542 RepID=A0ABW5PDS2_9BACL
MNANERLEQLERKVLELEQQMEKLRQDAGNRSGQEQERKQRETPAPYRVKDQEEPVRQGGTPHPGTARPPRPQHPAVDWEHVLAKIWLPRIFMLVLMAGMVWSFKAAVDSGLLNEPVRCLLGFAAGTFLLFWGIREQEKHRELLAQVLMGGAVGLYMLTAYAAANWYQLIPESAAFGFTVVLVVASLWLSYNYKLQGIAVIASAAGVMAPFLVRSAEPAAVFFTIYESLLYVTFLVYAIRFGFTKLFYVSFLLLHAAFAIFVLKEGHSGVLVWGVLVQHAVIAGAFFIGRLPKPQLKAFLASFALAALWSGFSLGDAGFELLMLVFTLVYASVSIVMIKRSRRQNLPYSITLGCYALLLFLFSAVHAEGALPGLLLAEGFIGYMLGQKIRSRFQKVNSLIIYALGIISSVPILIEGMERILSWNSAIWIILLSTAYGMYFLLRNQPEEAWKASGGRTILVMLSVVVLLFLTDVSNILASGFPAGIQHLSVSAVWAAYAVAVILTGMRNKHKNLRILGIALLLLTLMKVVFWDLPAVSVFVRAILFLGLGGLGVLLSRLWYREDKTSSI